MERESMRLDGSMDVDKFYEMMMTPDAPDEMVFQIRSNAQSVDKTFSVASVNNIKDQFGAFLLARVMAQFHIVGVGPKEVAAQVRLHWRTTETNQILLPWYEVIDKGEALTALDATKRYPRPGG
jgi:hypothetical protein